MKSWVLPMFPRYSEDGFEEYRLLYTHDILVDARPFSPGEDLRRLNWEAGTKPEEGDWVVRNRNPDAHAALASGRPNNAFLVIRREKFERGYRKVE